MDQESHVMSADEDPRTPEQIRMEIDNTRAALDRTVSELEDRLQPRHLYEEAKSAATARMWDATTKARDAARRGAEQAMALGYRTADRVRESPATTMAAVVGAGAAIALTLWGMKRRRTPHRMRAPMSLQPPFAYGANPVRRPSSSLSRNARPRMMTTRARRPMWRRPGVVGAALAALGTCSTYAMRRRV